MLSFTELLQKAEPQSHLVQLHGSDDDLLLGNVTRYIDDGLKKSEAVVVIATSGHIAALAERLEELGEAPAAVTFLEAGATLELFMVEGQPDLQRFEATVGETIRTLADDRPVRAYGEMVGVLWQAGQFSSAIRLEHLWNELLNSVVFSLFCAYPIDVFGPQFKSSAVNELLCAHTHMVPAGVPGDLQSALNRAMDDVLGSKIVELRPLMKAAERPAWGEIPKGEATILWLRNHLPHYAESILDRAKAYYADAHGQRRGAGLAFD